MSDKCADRTKWWVGPTETWLSDMERNMEGPSSLDQFNPALLCPGPRPLRTQIYLTEDEAVKTEFIQSLKIMI